MSSIVFKILKFLETYIAQWFQAFFTVVTENFLKKYFQNFIFFLPLQNRCMLSPISVFATLRIPMASSTHAHMHTHIYVCAHCWSSAPMSPNKRQVRHVLRKSPNRRQFCGGVAYLSSDMLFHKRQCKVLPCRK